MTLSKKTPRLDITIDEVSKKILVQQRWKYEWKCDPGTTPWQTKEKQLFHVEADRLIWKNWSKAFLLKVKGQSSFARNNEDAKIAIHFDIRWVNINEHWKVKVRKIMPGFIIDSGLNWETKVIDLDTEDIKLTQKTHGSQYPISHEFGHTIGNVPFLTHGDEYHVESKFFKDKNSIMNNGMIIRKRHLDFIVRELNTMIDQTTFYL